MTNDEMKQAVADLFQRFTDLGKRIGELTEKIDAKPTKPDTCADCVKRDDPTGFDCDDCHGGSMKRTKLEQDLVDTVLKPMFDLRNTLRGAVKALPPALELVWANQFANVYHDAYNNRIKLVVGQSTMVYVELGDIELGFDKMTSDDIERVFDAYEQRRGK